MALESLRGRVSQVCNQGHQSRMTHHESQSIDAATGTGHCALGRVACKSWEFLTEHCAYEGIRLTTSLVAALVQQWSRNHG
jgi:hypothetical protein